MVLNISLVDKNEQAQSFQNIRARIKVIGVGGAGGNAVDSMIRSNMEGVEFIVCNTDQQALSRSLPNKKIQLGFEITQGQGTGAKPDIGARSAQEASEDIKEVLRDTQLLFLTAGMGGGTGTGATPLVAKYAREMGVLTAAVVTQPFHFEGNMRLKLAQRGIKELGKHVDILVVINNQNLLMIADEKTTFKDAFKMTDDVLASGIRGITDLMTLPGVINLDFSDIATIMNERGRALIGSAEEEGEGRALRAATKALSNQLLDGVDIGKARGFLINVSGGSDLGLIEVDKAVTMIREAAPASAQLIFGASISQKMQDKIRITILATGVEPIHQEESSPADSEENYSASDFQAEALLEPRIEAKKESQPVTTQPKLEPELNFDVNSVQQPATVQTPTPQPAVQQPTAQQPATVQTPTPQPAVQQPATVQTPTPQPAVQQPTAQQPATVQTPTPQPAVQQPTTVQTPTPQPAVQQPAIMQPVENYYETVANEVVTTPNNEATKLQGKRFGPLPPIHEMVIDDAICANFTNETVANINRSIAGKQVEDINTQYALEKSEMPEISQAERLQADFAPSHTENLQAQNLQAHNLAVKGNVRQMNIAEAELKIKQLRAQIQIAHNNQLPDDSKIIENNEDLAIQNLFEVEAKLSQIDAEIERASQNPTQAMHKIRANMAQNPAIARPELQSREQQYAQQCAEEVQQRQEYAQQRAEVQQRQEYAQQRAEVQQRQEYAQQRAEVQQRQEHVQQRAEEVQQRQEHVQIAAEKIAAKKIADEKIARQQNADQQYSYAHNGETEHFEFANQQQPLNSKNSHYHEAMNSPANSRGISLRAQEENPVKENQKQKKQNDKKNRIMQKKKQEFSNEAQPDIFSLPFDENVSDAQIATEAEMGAELLSREELDIPAFLRRQAN